MRRPSYTCGLPWLRSFGVWCAVVGLLGACASEPESAEPRVVLEDCEPGTGPLDAQCGTVPVFEDRSRASGRSIDLKVVVFPALSRRPQPDPVFVLAGGPGQAAAQLSSVLAGMLRDVRQDRDLVFVDQRGTGESNGLPCETDDWEFISDVNFAVETLRQCLDGYDADLRFYTTPLAMDDLDEVREKLGYSTINLWGGSYGTRAALVYLRRHGEHVRSVVLDGAVPLAMKLPLSFPEDGQRALDLTLEACEREDPCRQRFPDLRRKLARLLDRLERKPLRVTVAHPRTGDDLDFEVRRSFVASSLQGALYSPVTASMIPLFIEQAHDGEFGGLLALALSFDSQPASTKVSWGMFFSVVCAEDLPWIDNRERSQGSSGTFLGESLLEMWDSVCAEWPRGAVAHGYHEPVRSDIAALVLSGELDPVTPPRWGETLAEGFSRARHIVVPGLGHGTSSAGCVPELIAQFIRDADGEGLDVACVQKLQRPPFFVTHGGPTMANSQ